MDAGRSKPGPDSLYLYIYIIVACQKGHPHWLQWSESKYSQAQSHKYRVCLLMKSLLDPDNR